MEFLDSSTNFSTQNTFVGNLSSINDCDINLILEEIFNAGSSFQTNERSTNNNNLLRVLEISLETFKITEITESENVLGVNTFNGDSTRSTTSGNQELIEMNMRSILSLDKVTFSIDFSYFDFIDNINTIGFEEFLGTIL